MSQVQVCTRRLGMALSLIVMLTIQPAVARDWMDPTVVAAAERLFAAMPDDYFTLKPIPAQHEIGTGTPVLLDVREATEFQAEHIAGAQNLPLRQLVTLPATLPASRAAPLLTYCKTGHRGAIALTVLRLLGYTNVRNLSGGLEGWKAAGLPVTQ